MRERFEDVLGEFRNSAKLIGGFCCRLNDAEGNQWSEFIGKQPEYKNYDRANAKVSCPTISRDEFLTAWQEREAYLEQLYDIGKRWYGELRYGKQPETT